MASAETDRDVAAAREDDRRLLRRFLEGDPAAVALVRGWVEWAVRRWRLDDADAAVQDALVEALRQLRAGRFREASRLRTYVCGLAINVCSAAYRRQRGIWVDLDDARMPSGGRGPESQAIARQELRRRLHGARYVLQRLGEDCRRLLGWAFLERWSSSEIGDRLGIRDGTVRVRVHRCLKAARALAETLGDAPAPLPRPTA